jgi:hypothetical protein
VARAGQGEVGSSFGRLEAAAARDLHGEALSANSPNRTSPEPEIAMTALSTVPEACTLPHAADGQH